MNLCLALDNEDVSDSCPCHWSCKKWKNKTLYASEVSTFSLADESLVSPEVIVVTATVWWRQPSKTELLYPLPAGNWHTTTAGARDHLWLLVDLVTKWTCVGWAVLHYPLGENKVPTNYDSNQTYHHFQFIGVQRQKFKWRIRQKIV